MKHTIHMLQQHVATELEDKTRSGHILTQYDINILLPYVELANGLYKLEKYVEESKEEMPDQEGMSNSFFGG